MTRPTARLCGCLTTATPPSPKATTEEGLGSGIVLYWDEGQKEAGKTLGLPDDYEVTCVMKIGVPDEEGYARDKNPYFPRRPEFSWLHYDRFKSE